MKFAEFTLENGHGLMVNLDHLVSIYPIAATFNTAGGCYVETTREVLRVRETYERAASIVREALK